MRMMAHVKAGFVLRCDLFCRSVEMVGGLAETSRPATLMRSLRHQGTRLARAALSSRRTPRQFTKRPPKRGWAFRCR